ncbi:hypothetical protein GCM10009733_003520 [Nonomuraea maheshkhaliensis]|uniref:Uncharacterized protein n=1 Tax=Nonomuraea maheshkhaliensis TaxID=419590 RepID=A0ABN2ELT6_9ACTN
MYWDTNHLDADTRFGLDELLRATAQSVRQASALAALIQELRDRQLAVLHGTYPAWDITLERDSTERLWWTAVPRRSLTVELVTEGVMRIVLCEDAIALATALAWQSTLINNVENRAGYPHVHAACRLQGRLA